MLIRSLAAWAGYGVALYVVGELKLNLPFLASLALVKVLGVHLKWKIVNKGMTSP